MHILPNNVFILSYNLLNQLYHHTKVVIMIYYGHIFYTSAFYVVRRNQYRNLSLSCSNYNRKIMISLELELNAADWRDFMTDIDVFFCCTKKKVQFMFSNCRVTSLLMTWFPLIPFIIKVVLMLMLDLYYSQLFFQLRTNSVHPDVEHYSVSLLIRIALNGVAVQTLCLICLWAIIIKISNHK